MTDSIGAMPMQRASGLAVWSALVTVYLVWGSTYLAIAIVVQTLPPLLSAGLRFLVAGLALVAWIAARRGIRAFRLTRDGLVAAGVVGLLLLVGGNGLIMLAERTVASGLTALIIASVPLWIIALRRLSGDRLPLSTAIGVVVGFGGVAFLVVPRGLSGQLDPIGLLLIVAATVSFAGGTFLSPRLALPRDGLVSTAIQQLAAGVALLVLGLLIGEADHLDPATFSARSIVALAYLLVFGSLVAFTAYSWLLQHAPVSLVATYAYVNPVVAVALGFLVLAEPITPSILIGAAIIVASVAYIVSREGARQRAARAVSAAAPAAD